VIDGEIVVTPEPRPRPSSPHGDGPTN
jgi:hypothetical protein